MTLTELEIGALQAAAVDCAVPNCVLLYLETLRRLAKQNPPLVKNVSESGEGYWGRYYTLTDLGRKVLADLWA